MEEQKPKKKSIILFFIKLVILFIIFDVLNSKLYPIISQTIIYGRFGREFIIESVCCLIALIALIMAKNTYIFNEKGDNIFKSIKTGGFVLAFAMLGFIGNLKILHEGVSFIDLLSLILYCISIGIFEEFLCRGWIQNEFMERFSKTRNQVLLSIALSSLIFGGMHISNIWIGGQGVIETLGQIVQATGMGILLGSIYYRTKNIWACVLLHGFWDFAIFLGEINVIKACTEGNVSNTYMMKTFVTAVILSAIYIIVSLYILRKSKISHLVEVSEEEIKKSESNKGRLIFLVVVLYYGLSMFLGSMPEENNEICYDYKEMDIYYSEIIYPIYKEYEISNNDINYKLYLKGDKLFISNNNIEKEIKVSRPSSFIVIENDNQYHILVRGINEYGSDTIIYYSNFITKDKLLDTEEYMNSIIDSFKELDTAPTTSNLGYIVDENNIKYIFIETMKSERLVLFEDKFYILNRLDSIKEKEEDPENNQEVDKEVEDFPIEEDINSEPENSEDPPSENNEQ